MNNNTIKYKVVLLGGSRVGKTSLLRRYFDNNFNSSTSPTIGVEIGIKLYEIKGRQVRLSVWDTAGHEKFRSITRTHYHNVNGVLFVYDISDPSSINRLNDWYQDVQKYIGNPDVEMFLIGNKTDLFNEENDKFHDYRLLAQSWAADRNIHYCEASARSGSRIFEAFEGMVEKIYDSDLERGIIQPISAEEEKLEIIHLENSSVPENVTEPTQRSKE